MERIVVKVGSNVLTTDKGKLNVTRLSALVDQIAWLKEHRYEVILVSSGAVACGRSELKVEYALDSVEQRQLYSAIGQVKLINHYYDLFREYGIHIGQVLTMKENFEEGEQYDNQRACMEVMLDNGVIPIVNENDTVSVTGLMFPDNDELAGLIAKMMGAKTRVLLSNIDGIYAGDPSEPSSEVIRLVRPDDCIDEYIQTSRSSAGRGGMESKYHTAQSAAAEGIRVIIANGNRDNILPGVLTCPEDIIHTEFVPRK
ncbi:MAG: glutamate 5-kinase [Prevotella sp.]|nr:glutamate 5-kinase [Prevotella sp.]